MNVYSVIALLCVIVNIWNFIVAFTILTIALINYRRCSNFSTILVCNTALATIIYAVTNVSAGIFMIIWDQESIPTIDSLCSTRAFIYHSSIAAIHHSFMLQAIYRFCKVKGSTLLATKTRKVGIILIQWMVDFTFVIPAFATGNLKKLTSDNLCFVNLSTPIFFIWMSILAYFTTDVVVNVIYKLLLRHLGQISSTIYTIQQWQMRRHLTVVRRIVLLNTPLAIVGMPTIVVVVLTAIHVDILPNNIIRIAFLITNIPISIILIILFKYTPELRDSVNRYANRVRAVEILATSRVYPRPPQPPNHP